MPLPELIERKGFERAALYVAGAGDHPGELVGDAQGDFHRLKVTLALGPGQSTEGSQAGLSRRYRASCRATTARRGGWRERAGDIDLERC
jgi:hypothetical protein